MKKRIRYISILMIICILGIISVQGFWLFNAWRIAYSQFGRSINGALGEAAGRKGFADMRAFLKAHPSFNPGRDPQFRPGGLVGDEDHQESGYFESRRRQPQGRPDNFQPRTEMLPGVDSTSPENSLQDSTQNGLSPSWYFIADQISKEPYDLASLDSIYRDELEERGIRTPFVLDSQHVTRAEFRNEAFRKNWRDHTRLQTHWVRVNTSNDIFVRATFLTPYGYLFGKLSWILVASLVLLALITWCLIYMLRTILKQKRWSEVKNDFISNMTHELKTPIATVSAAVEALRHFHGMEDKSKSQSYLDISAQELKRLTDLVEKVLNVSVEESEEMLLNKEQVNLEALIDSILQRHKIHVGKEVRLEFDHSLENPIVRVDKLHFSNAIGNLVDNAIKYSLEKATVHISLKSKDAWVILSIKDNGIGIPAYYQRLIFDKFFRVPTGDLHNVKGFGLGLSYVKKVVERHGGEIHVHSEPSQGSEFIISIPR